jgi:uncharacterized membrane protein
MSALRNLREEAAGVLALLILGAGLLAMFYPTVSPVDFWVVWVVGFAVVLPIFGILFDDEAEETGTAAESAATPDPLEELRRRYAEGEIDEAEFERRLERLLETEDEAVAADYVARRRAAGERAENRDPAPESE